MENHETLSLLRDVDACIKKYEKKYKENKYSFNIFSILRNERDEVYLHSKFIYELLRVDGKHQMGEVFLALFFDQIKYSYTMENLQMAKVDREYDNIDILIRMENKAVIIENKIDAPDRENQLNNYNNKMKKRGYKDEDIQIYYLSLGREPNEHSVRGLNKEVNLVSYETDIISWLNKCKEVTMNEPEINEVLKQYELLINKLTGNELGSEFKMELINKILLTEDNFSAALKIEEAMTDAKVEVMKRFWDMLEEKLTPFMKQNNCRIIEEYRNYKKEISNYYNRGRSYLGLTYFVKNISENINLYFSIEVEDNLYFGFFLGTQNKNSEIVRDINKDDFAKNYSENEIRLDNTYEGKCVDGWLGWKYYYESGDRFNFRHFNSGNHNVVKLINEKDMNSVICSIYEEVNEAFTFTKW